MFNHSDVFNYIKNKYKNTFIYQCKLLPHRPRLLWQKLWIRKDEFHSNLDLDISAMLSMNEFDRRKYTKNLIARRQEAHDRDCE